MKDKHFCVQVMQNLMACGAINFAVRIDCSELDRLTLLLIFLDQHLTVQILQMLSMQYRIAAYKPCMPSLH